VGTRIGVPGRWPLAGTLKVSPDGTEADQRYLLIGGGARPARIADLATLIPRQ
jgi:hypothetical protein